LKKHSSTLLVLLSLAIAITVGCGDSHSVPKFTKVAFMSNRTVSPATAMFTSNLDGTNVTPIPFSTTNVDFLSVSADGKKAVFSSSNNVWAENTDGSGQNQLTTSGQAYYPKISPNGKKIVYGEYDTTVSTYVEWIANFDGSGKVNLTATMPSGMTECYEGNFSADSSQVVFLCYGAGTYGLYTAKTDGSGVKTVLTGSSMNFPSFTPDSKKIVFTGNVTTAAIRAFGARHSGAGSSSMFGVGSVNIDGTGEALLVPNADEVIILNSTLYYVNSCTFPEQIFKANLDGTSAVTISDGVNSDDLFYAGGGC